MAELQEYLDPLADCVCACADPSDREVPAQPAFVPNNSELMQAPPSSGGSITLETVSMMHPGNEEARTSQGTRKQGPPGWHLSPS